MQRSLVASLGISVLLALAPLTGETRQPSRSAVPKSPGFFKRMLGMGHPGHVRQALKQIRGQQGAARDQVLTSAFRSGIRKGDLSVHSATRLAKKMSKGTRDRMLRVYARHYEPELSVKQVRKLASTTHTHGANNRLLERFANARIKTGLSMAGAIKLSKATTYVGPANRILDAYKAHNEGKLTKRQLKKLRRSRAVPSSGSSSSDDGYSVMNVGGVNIGGVTIGGASYGGVKVGNMNVGGVNVGGTSFGGVSAGGVDLF